MAHTNDLVELATFAGKPLGSGANFAKLRSKLAARGAKDPDKLAAWIGRRKYGKRFGRISHGSSHSNAGPAIQLADGPEPYRRGPDETVQCPNCGKYNAPDARYCDQCGHKLPDSAFASLSNAMEFAMPTARVPAIRTPSDLVISRGEGGVAIIRHRAGGGQIGTIRRDGSAWRAAIDGRDLDPRTHQRSALADLIGTHNRGALTENHRPASAGPELQPPAQQTPLMQQFGIPAVRLATPTMGASDGPRTTDSDSGSDSGDNGLSPKGKQIYAKLIKKGFPAARAMAFAKRAQNFGGAKS